MELAIYVHGHTNDMDAAQVLTGLHQVAELIKALGGGAVHFAHLRDGSVDAAFRPMQEPDTTDAAFRRLVAGLRIAENGAEIPDGWNDTAIQAGRDAAAHLGGFDAEGTELTLRDGDKIVDRVRITLVTRDHLREAGSLRRTSIGSVIGHLDSLNVHERYEARIWPERGGKSVVIRFTAAQLDNVRSLIGRRVEARGKLIRDYRGRPLSLQLRAITRLPTRDESPRLASGLGIAEEAVTSTVKDYLGGVHGTA
ncbi:hypothetical protein [Amycolatopsis sp. RTGN1]|uniref:hypothetical protein n=1 Tax=Amycolatopsis ponsaeliensis TaxID=2992142 RepID=UPI00254A98D2|nr:hypothetical protein [Amycolatopsis sp. RTGN1]